MGSVHLGRKLELRQWGQVGALREAAQTLRYKPNKSQETAVATHLSPAGSVIWGQMGAGHVLLWASSSSAPRV